VGQERAAFSGRRILVVEDDSTIALDIGRALSAEGAIVVRPGAIVSDAHAEIAQNPFYCDLLDIKLGDGNADTDVGNPLRPRLLAPTVSVHLRMEIIRG
jgi:ActR/RegA family two-component response regulator